MLDGKTRGGLFPNEDAAGTACAKMQKVKLSGLERNVDDDVARMSKTRAQEAVRVIFAAHEAAAEKLGVDIEDLWPIDFADLRRRSLTSSWQSLPEHAKTTSIIFRYPVYRDLVEQELLLCVILCDS